MKKVISSVALALSLVLGGSTVHGVGYNQPLETQEFIDQLESFKEKSVSIIVSDGEHVMPGGMGWLLEGGYVVTNAHVIKKHNFDVKEIYVGFYYSYKEGPSVAVAKVVDKNEPEDIALLKFDAEIAKKVGLKHFEFSDTIPAANEPVLTIAALPKSDFFYDISEGSYIGTQVFSWETYYFWDNPSTKLSTVINSTFRIDSKPGNSGGPIINKQGKIVSMMRGYDSQKSLFGIGVSLDKLKSFVDAYKESVKPRHAVSVEVITPNTKE